MKAQNMIERKTAQRRGDTAKGSVIIPTFNEEKYIGNLLDCLCSQDTLAAEVIVVDGGSDDCTQTIVKRYMRKLPLKLIDAKKRNVAYQRNLGVIHAEHDRIVFLDADGIVPGDFLTKVTQLPKDAIAIPRYKPASDDWKYHTFFFFINTFFHLLRKLSPCGIGICIVSSKQRHDSIGGFDESLQWAEDMDYIQRSARTARLRIIKSKVYTSVRRFETDGTKIIMKRWLYAYWLFLRGRLAKLNSIDYFSEKKRILLVQPKSPHFIDNITGKIRNMAPLSLLTLASMTPNDTFDVELVDLEKHTIDYSKKYDLIGITCSTVVANGAYKIARRFRKEGIKVIIGGIHPTFMTKEALNNCDSVIRGEGENIWPFVLNDFLNGKLKEIYEGGYAKPESIPILKPELFKGYLIPTTQTGRGCPNQCEFCSSQAFNGNHIRKRKIKDIITELKGLKESKARFPKFVGFVDDNFFADKPYANKIMKEIRQLNIYWGTYATINIGFDKALLNEAYASGCRYLLIGLESINPSNLHAIKKPDFTTRYAESLRNIKAKGIIVHTSFVFGFDNDTKTTVKDTIDFALKNNIDEIGLQILRPMPGTPLFKRYKKEGKIETYNWSKYEGCVIKLKNINPKELIREIRLGYKRFYSLKNIMKRIQGLKNMKARRITAYLMINLAAWYKTKKGISA